MIWYGLFQTMDGNLSLGRRYRLKGREIKEILLKVSSALGISISFSRRNVEVAQIDSQNRIFLIGEKPAFIDVKGEVVPSLLNREVLALLPTLIVDMGAVPHICNGADVMAPGIVTIDGEFQKDVVAVVVDEKYSKHIALVKTLCESSTMGQQKRGKVARNIHYVGDKVWAAYKHMNRI